MTRIRLGIPEALQALCSYPALARPQTPVPGRRRLRIPNPAVPQTPSTLSEALLIGILDAALDAIITIDGDGAIISWSAQAERMFGWTALEVVGRLLSTTIIPERLREQHEQGLARMRAGGAARILNRRLELPALHRQGHEIPVELTVTRVQLRDRCIFSAFIRDLSEQKRSEQELRRTTEFLGAAEDALRQANDQLSAVIEAAPLAIFTLGLDGLVKTWNPEAERLFGWTAAETIGKVLPFVPDQDLPASMELRRRVSSGERLTGVELVRRTRSGGVVCVKAFSAPIHDAAGALTGVLSVVQDVTAVKQLEQKVIQAQKMEAVGRLAGGIAHDFNNLLTVIVGGCDLLLLDIPEPDVRREEVHEILKAADRAASLTRQLLSFSRQQVLMPQVLDLNALVTGMESMLRRLLGEDVALHCVAGPGLGAVEADPGHLEQVILNLAVNARDAMPGGGTLTIETANVDLDAAFTTTHPQVEPGRYVRLAVCDTGTGLNEHARAHIFEPFFTTKERGKGTGLGLATVYGIVKQSGGFVDASNEPEGGAVFRVYLPWVEHPAEPGSAATAPSRPPNGTETILVVEDDVQVRAIVREALTRYGYSVIEVADADEALALEARLGHRLDLLITDVVLPGRSGLELATALRLRRPGLRVLFMSGYTDDRTSLVREAAGNFLQKPFGPETLARKARETLDRQPSLPNLA